MSDAPAALRANAGRRPKRGDRRGLHRQRKRRRWPLPVALVVLVFLLAAAGGVYVDAATLKPVLSSEVKLAQSVTTTGPALTLDWPRQGHAAIAVSGVAGFAYLGSTGSAAPVPIASVAKVMTAYVILKDFPITGSSGGFEVTLGQDAVEDTNERASAGESVVAVRKGEQLSEVELLEGMLIPSGNNMAEILADYDGGIPSFVAKMNATARSLGMASTTYTDPSGFEATTVSTAHDQTILAAVAMRVPAIATIVGMRAAVLPVAGTIHNYNPLLGSDGFTGIKTGSDTAAGGNLMFFDRRAVDGRWVSVYGAVLGQGVGEILTSPQLAAAAAAARSLVDSVFAGLRFETVLPAGTTVLTVSNAQHRSVEVVTVRALSVFGWGGVTLALHVSELTLGSGLSAGQIIGSVDLGTAPVATPGAQQVAGSGGVATTPITATATMPPVTFNWKLHHIL